MKIGFHRKLIIREFLWFTGTLSAVFALSIVLFGFEGFSTNTSLDIHFYDTYYVVPNQHFMSLINVLCFFAVYLVRGFFGKFKNAIVNVVLMISTILMIVVLIGIYTYVETLIQQSGWSIYPPLSAIEIEPEIQTDNSSLETRSNVLFFIIWIKLIFLSFVGFKTGEIYGNSKC